MYKDSLTITLSDKRLVDAIVKTAYIHKTTPEIFALEILRGSAKTYASLHKIGVITSADLISRFTPEEFSAITVASIPIKNPQDIESEEEREKAFEHNARSSTISSLIKSLNSEPTITLDDPKLISGLNKLVSMGFLTQDRVAELLSYDRPEVLE